MRDRPRLAVVGCGRVFERFHLPALRTSSHWELAAVCDSNPRRQQWAERTLPDLGVFDSIDQMLIQVELDAVLIAAPPPVHTTLAARVVHHGLHVLIEKPGGRSLADAEEIARIANRSDRVLWIGYNRRFNVNYMAIRDTLRVFPPLASALVSFDLSLSAIGWGSISGYLGESNQGGDVVRDLASHQLDLVVWMFSSPVISVRIRSWDRIGSPAERLAYDARLETGVTIQCLAEHGEHYRESLAVEVGGRRFLGYPTGLLTTERRSWRSLEQWAELRYWIDRKLIRLGIIADPLKLSYQAQLEAFATAVRGDRPSVIGSSVDSLLMTHRAMQVMLEGRDKLGVWRTP